MNILSSGLRATTGTPYKLMSAKGTLLGVLTVPDWIADRLSQRDGRDTLEFALVRPASAYPGEVQDFADLMMQVAVLARSYHGMGNDGVVLFGATIEQIEAQPGFSFSPSAAYLRSLIE